MKNLQVGLIVLGIVLELINKNGHGFGEVLNHFTLGVLSKENLIGVSQELFHTFSQCAFGLVHLLEQVTATDCCHWGQSRVHNAVAEEDEHRHKEITDDAEERA